MMKEKIEALSIEKRDEVENVIKVGNYKIDLNEVIRKNIDSFKEGDFSMLSDDETMAFLNFIGRFVIEYGRYFEKDEYDDIVYDVFLRVMQSKLYNLDIDRKEKPTTYLGLIVKGSLNHIIKERETHKRKINYNQFVKVSLDAPISKNEVKRINLNRIPANQRNILDDYQDETYKSFMLSLCKKDELLRLYFVENMTYDKIAGLLGNKSRESARQKINKSLAFLKMELAEAGYFDKVEVDEKDKAEYFYIRKRITQNGITSAHVVDEVSIETLSKYLNIDQEYINSKILDDGRQLSEILLQKINLKTRNSPIKSMLELYYNIFGEYSKNFDKIPEEWLKYATENIMLNDYLKYYFVYPHQYNKGLSIINKKTLSDEEFEDIVYENVYKLKESLNKFIREHPIDKNALILNEVKKRELKGKSLGYIKRDQKYNFAEIEMLYSEEDLEFVRQRIYENPLLKDYYINNMSYKVLAEKNNMRQKQVQYLIFKCLIKMKIDLAEEGIFPNMENNAISKEKIDKIKESIKEIGLSASILIKKFSLFDIEKVCSLKHRNSATKLNNDKLAIREKLTKNSIPFSDDAFSKEVYIKILGHSKIKDISDEEIKYVYQLIKENPFIERFYICVDRAKKYYSRRQMSESEMDAMLENEILVAKNTFAERFKKNINKSKMSTKFEEKANEKTLDGR